jgi:hypothetical protein
MATMADMVVDSLPLSIIIPAHNEAAVLGAVLGANALPGAVFFPLTRMRLPRWQIAAPFMAYAIAFTAAATFSYQRVRWR